MKKAYYFLFLIILLSTACKKTVWPSDEYAAEYNFQEVVGFGVPSTGSQDRFAMYQNGQQGIIDLISQNTIYPMEAIQKGIYGRVSIKYIVEIDGYVRQLEVTQSVDPLLDNEAIRVMKLMKRWIPAKEGGKLVRCSYTQPINFKK